MAEKSLSELRPVVEYAHDFLVVTISRAIFYPLDVAQILLQVKADDARDNPISTLLHLYKTYGFSSWYRGFLPATLCVSSASMRRNLYPLSLKGALISSGTTQVVLASIFPLQVAKVRMITSPKKYKITTECIQTIYEEEGLSALFRGISASLIGWIPATLVSYLSFEIFYWIFGRTPQGTLENIGFGTVTNLLIGLLEYPVLTAEAIRQSQVGDPDPVWKILIRIATTQGIKGLYPGFTCLLLKIPQRYLSSFISRRSKKLFLKVPSFRANIPNIVA